MAPDLSLVRRSLQCPYGEGTIRDRVRKKAATMDKKGRTPLHWAAVLGYSDAMMLLLPSGAVVNALDQQGYTPLMLAGDLLPPPTTPPPNITPLPVTH